MRHIYRNNITAIIPGSEQANYPASNMFDDHPKRLWRATAATQTETVVLEIAGGVSDIAFFGTNAVMASAVVVDPNVIEWGDDILGALALGSQDEWGDEILGGGALGAPDEWASLAVTATGTVEQRAFSEALWIELSDTLPGISEATITLTVAAGQTVHAGVVRAAIANDYGATSPESGLVEGRRDFSVSKENQNGSRYYKKRDIVRTFSGEIITTTNEWYKLAQGFDTVGAIPTAWRLSTLESNNWIVFGYLSDPTCNYVVENIVQAQVNITEVI